MPELVISGGSFVILGLLFMGLCVLCGYFYLQSRKSTFAASQGFEDVKSVLDHLPGYASIIDSELRYCFLSKSLRDHLKVPAESLLGRELGWRGKNEEFVTQVRNILQSEQPSAKFMTRLDLGAGLRVYEVYLTKEALPNYVVSYSVDVTELMNLEQQHREDLERLSSTAKLALVGELASGVAVQIDAKLAPILSIGKELREIMNGEVDEAAKSKMIAGLEKIIRTAEKISKTNKILHGSLGGGES